MVVMPLQKVEILSGLPPVKAARFPVCPHTAADGRPKSGEGVGGADPKQVEQVAAHVYLIAKHRAVLHVVAAEPVVILRQNGIGTRLFHLFSHS